MTRRGERGTTWAESVAAIALIGLAIMTATGVTLAWNHTARRLSDRMVATEALASEMARLRATGLDRLPEGTGPWMSDADKACGLRGALGTLAVVREQGEPFRRVRVELSWDGGRLERETLAGAR